MVEQVFESDEGFRNMSVLGKKLRLVNQERSVKLGASPPKLPVVNVAYEAYDYNN